MEDLFSFILWHLFSRRNFAGSFAVWGTLFSICDCTFTYIRKKEDPWNAIASGAATGGLSDEYYKFEMYGCGNDESAIKESMIF